MSTVLLIVIYIAFIGLGIPDSLFGTAWPAIYAEFQLPISYAGFVSVVISGGTIVSSMLSARVIKRLGTGRVSLLSTALTAAALIGFSCSKSLGPLCLLAVPLGLGAGSIDTALNNYVSLHYSATHMSFLHCFYGVGVSVSPFVLSLVISGEQGWRGGYRIAFGIQLCITLILLLALPLWNKAHRPKVNAPEQELKVLSLKESLSIPGVQLMCLLFICSCGIEFSCGGWGSTYLVEYRHMAAEKAAGVVTFYYMGMTAGRFLSGVLAARMDSWQIIRLGQCVLGIAIFILLLPAPLVVSALALFLIGLGNGPLFPNFNYLTPRNFGADVSQSVMGVQMASSYVGIMLAPPVCGLLGQRLGMGIFPPYLLLFFLVMIAATRKIKQVLKA